MTDAADAKKLLAGYKGDGKPMETVVGELVDRLILQGWLINRDDHTILLTGYDIKDPNTLIRVEQMLKDTIGDRNIRANFLRSSDDAEKRLGDDAEKLGVTAGKLELMRLVTARNPQLSEKELTSRPVRDLLALLDDRADDDDDDDDATEAATEPRTEPQRPAPARPAPPAHHDDDDDDDWDDRDDYDDDDDWDDDDDDDDDWDDDDDDDDDDDE